MGLKLLLLLLLLVTRSSLLEKVDNGIKLDDSFFKRSMHSNFTKTDIFENVERNSNYFIFENTENEGKKIIQRSRQLNFGETNPLEKKIACENYKSKNILNNSIIITSPNQQDTPTLLTKKFLSDPKFKGMLKSQRDLNFLTTWLMNRKQSVFGKSEKSDRKRKKRRRTKLRTVSGNELADEVIVINPLRENAMSYVRTMPNLKNSLESETLVKTRRARRETQEKWIQKDFEGHDDILNLHAFIVRDEEVPECGNAASKITNTRYFMCSGVILTSKLVLTTASCVHYAHIYEHHIAAALSVLIGAVSDTTYVLRVKKYEMHPKYKHNAESRDHTTYNIAVLTIACNIPSDVLVLPKFPDKYVDISHLCCSNNCKILTVVQSPHNRHKIQLMSAKHIPAAIHDDTRSRRNNYFERSRRSLTFATKIKREGRIAPPPVFFTNEPAKIDENLGKNFSTLFSGKQASEGNMNKTSDQSTNATEDEFLEEMSREIMQGLFRGNFDVNSSNPLTTNTSEMSEKQSKAVTDFIKEITDKAMARVVKILDEAKNKKDNEAKSASEQEGNDLVDNIARTLKENILKEVEDSLNSSNLFDDTLVEPSSKYFNCPPLGTPVIVNRTLLGLVAYTCDDLQSWVPWQYVNIDRNLKWIKDTIAGNRNFPYKLSRSQASSPFGIENTIEASPPTDKDDKTYKDSQVDYKSSHVFDSIGERFKKDQDQSLKSTNSEDSPRLKITRVNNRLLSKEIIPISEKKFLQNSEDSLVLGKQFSGQNLVSKINDGGPRIAVNKCFLNEDDTVICRSQTVLEVN